ncbi:hypothetical protein WAK64_00710 [Bacillus spongiae]|uniref:Uncharacterized protein n=1 Tax=Bacillus spongiae TaxID=2683610 RepID=A0ABU8H8K7_9BACI
MENKTDVLALPEETGIHLSDAGIYVLGTQPATLFEGESKREVHPMKFI